MIKDVILKLYENGNYEIDSNIINNMKTYDDLVNYLINIIKDIDMEQVIREIYNLSKENKDYFNILIYLDNIGSMIAKKFLAGSYKFGIGTEKDDNKGNELFEILANYGDVDCQYNLGVVYYYGTGVEVDKEKAAFWFKKASDQGDLDAQSTLASMMFLGDGIKQDKEKAFELYELAAERGHEGAQSVVYTEWLVKALYGDKECQFNIGDIYLYGKYGIEKDIDVAIDFLEKAAAQDHAQSLYILSLLYNNGIEVTKDENKAIKYLKKASDLGDQESKIRLNEISEMKM